MAEPSSSKALFGKGSQVRRRSSRDQLGYIVSDPQRMGGEWWYSVFFGGIRSVNVPEGDLEPSDISRSIEQLLLEGIYANKESFSKLLTFTKLQYPLRNNIYSYRATRTEFKAYQFKPLLKLLDNPKHRMLIADEVGLGKTIEAGLILSELRARHPGALDRVLVACPAALCEKWQTELKKRFGETFEILDADGVRAFLARFDDDGDSARLSAICSIQSLRSRDVIEEWEAIAPPLDLLIIDEAHHLRNPKTLSHRAGRLLSDNADSVVLLTATPVHLGNVNLFYLLRLLDSEEFGSDAVVMEDKLGERLFDELLRANEPIVEAQRLLSSTNPPDRKACLERLRAVVSNPRTADLFTANPEFQEAVRVLSKKENLNRADFIQLQRRLASLNLLSRVFTRTRKREVETRVVREAHAVQVLWTREEQAIYDAVTDSVIRNSTQEDRFALFLAITPQRQIASCIPAACTKFIGTSAPSRISAFEETDLAWADFEGEEEPPKAVDVSDAVRAWQAAGRPDSKFASLARILEEIRVVDPGSKTLVFAYFKPTLEYLSEKLTAAGISNLVISGSYERELRNERMATFRNDPSVRVMLSSEVGSEGLDFEFCANVVNYDLPWNPMVVEQRIGRLDRIGQTASKIRIFNLSVPGTIEERILNRLYARIHIFERSIGDLEPILGDVIQQLTEELFSTDLTAQQQEERIKQAADALENKRQELEHLEANSAKFVGRDDYFVEEIERIGNKKRFVSGSELEVFLREFLDRHFPECSLKEAGAGAWELQVSDRLEHFVRQKHTADDHSLFEFLRRLTRGKLRFTFDSERAVKNSQLDLINLQHPLTRCIVSHYEANVGELHPVARVALESSTAQPGHYFYFVYRIDIAGARIEHYLYPIVVQAGGQILDEDVAEDLLPEMLTRGTTAESEVAENASSSYEAAEARFSDYLARKRQELVEFNNFAVASRLESLRQSYDAKLRRKQDLLVQARLRSASPKYLKMLEGTIRRLEADLKYRSQELEKERRLEITFDRVAAGSLEVSR